MPPLADDTWTDRLRRTLESYDEALLRSVAGKLCKPRNQWPTLELLDRCLATFDNPAVVDRRLGDLTPAARTLIVLISRSRQPCWAVGNLVELSSILEETDPLQPVQELLDAGLIYPDQFTRSSTLPRVKSFESWLGQSTGTPPTVFVHPLVTARALKLELTLPPCPGVVKLPPPTAIRPVHEVDGLDWLLRLTVLWQQVSVGPLRRTQQGDFFKRDLDRLRSDPLLSGAAADSLAEIPDPGLLTVALAQEIRLLEESEGELRVALFPEAWEQGLPESIADLWRGLLHLTTWNPVQGWTPTNSGSQPYPSLYLLALVLLSQLEENEWARPAELESWLQKSHPYWSGGRRRGEKVAVGVTQFLLGLAYQLRLLQATRDDKGEWAVRLSALGRWLLGQGAAPQVPTFSQTLLVQPNLEILVYRQGLSPSLLARLGRFAAWKGLGAALTMQLQPESVYLGLEAGETFETILQTLERHGMKALPETVVNALRTWANKRDRIQVYAAGALFEFMSEADLTEALARGLPAVRLGERLAIVASEKEIDYRHFRLTSTRDYGLPPEKCVDIEGDGVTLSIDLTRSDLLIEAEVQRFAEALDRKEMGRRFFQITPVSMAQARDCGLTLATIETWFPQRCGEAMPPAARLLYSAPQVAPATLRKLLVLEVASAELADGLEEWPGTRSLVAQRLGPTALLVEEEHAEALRERLKTLEMELKSLVD